MFRRNTAGQNLGFKLIKVADGTPGTGAAVTVYRSIDGGAQAVATGTVSEKGNGQYNFAPSQADTNGNEISFLFVATGMILEEKTIVATAADPTNGATFGVANLDAAVSSRSTYAGVDTAGTATLLGRIGGALTIAGGKVAATLAAADVTGNVACDLQTIKAQAVTAAAGVTFPASIGTSTYAGGAVASVNAPVTVGANNDKAGYALSGAGLDSIVIETGINARQALSPILAACAGVVAGAGTGTITIKGGNVATTRITAATDGSGNRTAVALALPA